MYLVIFFINFLLDLNQMAKFSIRVPFVNYELVVELRIDWRVTYWLANYEGIKRNTNSWWLDWTIIPVQFLLIK